jgi:hypothetical protein
MFVYCDMKYGKNNSIPNDIQCPTDSSIQICLTILLICKNNNSQLNCHILSDLKFTTLNATFNNISVLSSQSVLLVEETRVPWESHRHVASHWQTLYHIMLYWVHLAWVGFKRTNDNQMDKFYTIWDRWPLQGRCSLWSDMVLDLVDRKDSNTQHSMVLIKLNCGHKHVHRGSHYNLQSC